MSADMTGDAAAPTLVQKLAAEFLGTFVLVLVGVGSVVFLLARASDASAVLVDIAGIGFAFGLSVTVMVYAVGRISGGHFNPAVSFGAALGGRVPWSEAALYVVVQVVSAAVASAVIFAVGHAFPGWSADGRMGTDSFGSAGSGVAWWGAFVLEAVLTFVFVTVILAVTDLRNEHPALAPLAIGLTLAIIHFASIPVTGTSVNPARSIGPALFGGSEALKQLWLFIVAPLVGAAVSGLVYPLVFGRDTEPVAGSGLSLGRARPAGGVPGYGAPDAFQQQWQQPTGHEWPAHPGQQAGAPGGQPGGRPGGRPGGQPAPQPGYGAPAAPPQWPAQQPPAQQPPAQQPPAQQPPAEQPPAQQPPQVWPQQPGWPPAPQPGQPPQPGQQEPPDDDGRTQIRPQQ